MKIDLGVDYHVYMEDQVIDMDNLTYKQWHKSVRHLQVTKCPHTPFKMNTVYNLKDFGDTVMQMKQNGYRVRSH